MTDLSAAQVKDFDARFPNFFPVETSFEKKYEYLQKIHDLRQMEEFLKAQAFQRLDQQVLQKNKIRVPV